MPEKNLSKAGSGDSGRKFGDAPALGKVSRSPLSAVSGGRRRRSSRKHRNSAARKLTISLSLILILGMSALFLTYFRKRAAEASQADGSEAPASAFHERKTVEIPQLDRQEAIAIVKAAFADISQDAVEDYFVLGPGDNPSKAFDTLQKIAESEGTVTECEWASQEFSDGRIIAKVITHMVGADGSNRRLAQLVFGVDGKWRIDLDSYVRKCVPEWPEILSGKSGKSIVRAFIGPDTYYNGSFSDESKWQAFALSSVDVEDTLYAYVRRESPQAGALLKMFEAGANLLPATLEINAAADASTRQFEITGVLADGWVLSESRYDASF